MGFYCFTSYKYVMYQTTTARLHPTPVQRDVLFTMLNAGKLVYNRVRSEMFKTYCASKIRVLQDIGVYEDVAVCFANMNSATIPISESTVRAVAKEVYTSITSRPQAHYDGVAIRLFGKKTANSAMKILVDDVVIHSNHISIPNVGNVRCNMESHGAFDRGGLFDGIKTKAWISVNKHAVLSVSVSRTMRSKKKIHVDSEERVIGLDYGLRELATLSTGEVLKLPKKVHLLERRMRFYQSKRDTSMKTSNARKRWDEKYRTAYHNWRNLINGYCSNVASRLYRDYDIIVVEPLYVNEKLYHNRDRNRKNARIFSHGQGIIGYHAHNHNVLNSGLPELYKWLRIVAYKTGKRLITTYKMFPSTQICSVCGERNTNIRGTDIREWTCPNCGTVHDRDVNAARNMRAFGVRFMQNLNQSLLLNGHNSCNVDTVVTNNVSEMSESHSSVDSDESTQPILQLQKVVVSEDIKHDDNTLLESFAHGVSLSTEKDIVYEDSGISKGSTELTKGSQDCGVMTPLSAKTDGDCSIQKPDIDTSRKSAEDCIDIRLQTTEAERVRSRVHDMLQSARNSRRRMSVSCDGETPTMISASRWARAMRY